VCGRVAPRRGVVQGAGLHRLVCRLRLTPPA
jgi:hypothetical protein